MIDDVCVAGHVPQSASRMTAACCSNTEAERKNFDGLSSTGIGRYSADRTRAIASSVGMVRGSRGLPGRDWRGGGDLCGPHHRGLDARIRRLLIVAGVAEGIHAFSQVHWGGFFIDLFTSVLYVVAGALLVTNPLATALGLTLLIAMFLVVSGLFRAVASVAGRPPHWGWLLLHGIVSLRWAYSSGSSGRCRAFGSSACTSASKSS